MRKYTALSIPATIGLIIFFCLSCNSRPGIITDPLAIADEMEKVLSEGMMDHWYPLSIDRENGGFLSSFDQDWNPGKDQSKFIVMQARHTWTTARMAEKYPANPLYLEASRHGFEFLREVMWDQEYGGYFTLVNRRGQLIKEEDYALHKIAYGNAFAIYALAAYFKVSRDTAALEQAKKSFRWLDEHAHDPEFGGYFQFLSLDGTALKQGYKKTPPKDQNSSIHLLEGFTALYEVWKDEHLKARIEELLGIIRDTITTEKAYMNLFFRQDWSPVYYTDSLYRVERNEHMLDYISFGHDIETAFLMLETSSVLGRVDDSLTHAVAKRMCDHTINQGWDPESGATFESAYYFEDGDGITILEPFTQWWAATETFHTLLIMAELYPEDPMDYYGKFCQTWEYCKNYLIDFERGGWYRTGTNKHPLSMEGDKGSAWKGNYHNTRSLINSIQLLRRYKV